jgi:hypothetical protein
MQRLEVAFLGSLGDGGDWKAVFSATELNSSFFVLQSLLQLLPHWQQVCATNP